jgi:hypothetical protein
MVEIRGMLGTNKHSNELETGHDRAVHTSLCSLGDWRPRGASSTHSPDSYSRLLRIRCHFLWQHATRALAEFDFDGLPTPSYICLSFFHLPIMCEHRSGDVRSRAAYPNGLSRHKTDVDLFVPLRRSNMNI